MVSTSGLTFLYGFAALLGVCGLIGGFFAFRNGRQTQLSKFQEATNIALQQRIEALEGKIGDFEKENVIQRHIIDTITSALKQRGLLVTIDGDMVTIVDNDARVSQHRKRITTTMHQPSTITRKKEEGLT